MGSLSIWRRAFRMAEIFVVFASGMLHPVTGILRGRNSSPRWSQALECISFAGNHCGLLFAGGGLRLVLSVDGLLCSLAGVSHELGGLLAAVDVLAGGQNDTWRRFMGNHQFKCRNVFRLTSGHLDVAGQVLSGAGLYAIWCLWDAHSGGRFVRKFWVAGMTLILGWGLGFLLAAPHLLPLLEYAQSGSRMMHRSEGAEERPPGWIGCVAASGIA